MCLALFTSIGFAQEKETKPEAAEIIRELDWLVGDYAAFGNLIERAKAAEVPEAQLLLPQLDASLLYGDLEKLRAFLPKTESAKAEIIKKKGATEEAREEVTRSIKLARQFLTFAEKRPKETDKRAEMFRMMIFSHQTLEDARMVDAAMDQLAIEKNIAEGTSVTWEQVKAYLTKTTHLFATGATVFGDKFGPFTIGKVPTIPAATFSKLKDYLPAEAWEDYAPK